MERKLAAILAADVVGYSRLMAANETETLTRLQLLLGDVIKPRIAEFGGRVVKLMGDGLLADFSSTVNAVKCAAAIQQAISEHEQPRPDQQRISFRIGINLGDIIIDGDDIFGDGVNVAARLEALAEPNGICLSGTAYDTIDGKVDFSFADLGPQTVKNIEKPVRAYRLALSVGGVDRSPVPDTQLSIQDKPSIAVLPFDNMSNDPEQDYFSDGITEDIITELSRFNSLFVIARNSSFSYKHKSPNIVDVGRDLGVRYVVEGSVRKAGNRVRITAQLIDAQSGNHLWAERYDRDLEDIFEVQDEVVQEIVASVPGRLDAAALRDLQRRPPGNLGAYELQMQARRFRHQEWGSPAALKLLEKAIALDPQYGLAHAHISNWHSYSIFAHGANREAARNKTLVFGEKALSLEPNDSTVLAMVGEAYFMTGDLELARICMDKATRLNPNDYNVMSFAGVTYAYLGDIQQALYWNEKITRHDPISMEALRETRVEICYMAKRYQDAVQAFIGWQNPPIHMLIAVAAAYAQLGLLDEAAQLREQYLKRLPDGFSLKDHVDAQMKMCALPEHRKLWQEGYRKAGFDIP